MRTSRVITGVILATAITGAAFASSAVATTARSGSNTGTHSTASTGQVFRQSTSPNASRTVINRPNDRYVGHTCKFDLSSIPDFTSVTSLDACGITVTFSPAVEKRTVPDSWGSWGSPPDTESATPAILYSGGATSVTMTFSSPVRVAGFEAEPNPFEVHAISADFTRPAGGVKATVTRDIDGSSGARLLAIKTKNIGSVTLSSDVDFAFGQLRINLGGS